ncbi:uncharacterized protein [Lepeophtheirus salmonis]|uniref:uncharacterized protein n=1 Tax=Lepeophtheirus salmonis TaxID=72036 RepID=UPI001AEA63C8|nr:uncharacterized protein LOC121131816 [Lepeophtheirus salmonis]
MNIKKKSPILWLQLASVLLILLLHIDSTHTQQQECCSGLKVSSNGLSTRFQSSRLGIYHQVGTLSSRPIYKNEQRNEYLFYLTTRSRGLWMIGPNPGSFNGGIANRADHPCIENIPTGSWKYADGSGWKKDSELSFECYSDVTECLYSDDSVLEGGDLYPNSVSFVSGTFECIRLCSSTPRCRYWSVDKLMNETRHVCTLKAWKGELIPKKGYVSGSLPKACHESAEPSTQITPSSNNRVSASDDNACVYRNLEFEGGDLRLLQNISSFSECRGKCSEYIECSLFSHHILRRECRLKSNQVSVRRNLRVSSGASIKTCKQVLSLKKRKQFFGRSKSEFKKYEDNEINGQFRITSEKWNPELENQESQSFQEMSSTIKDSLLEMIMEDSDIRDKAKFDITIVGFSPGSVICNFRINYILKEAYVAIPFIIKPKNVTNALLDKFKFQRGILFQRFVIASGSFKASSPVDHCDAMGCSHKCTYDYALQDYRCICPPGLYLDGDDKNCVEESLTTTTTPSNLPSDDSELPENCLLSPWTRWSRCSATCGPSTRSRARVVILPSKNGGSCDGDLREEKSCNLPACPGAENEVVEENNEDDIDDSEIVTRPTIDVSSKRVQNKEIENAESIDFEKLKELAPTIKSYVINKGIPYFYINNKMYYIPLGTTKVLQPLEKNSNIYTIQYTHPDGLQEQFELTNIESPAPTPTSFKLVDPKVISLPELIKNLDKVSNYYTITERVYFIINGIPNRIGEGRTDIVQDEVSGIPQIKYTYPEGRMSFIRLNQFASNADNSNEKVKNEPVNVNVGEFQKLLSDIEFYHLVDGAPYFMINGRPYAISPGKTEIVPSSESGVYIIRHFKPDNSVYEIKIKNDIPLPTVSQLPTIHNLSQNNPEIVDIYELEKLIPEVSGFYFIGSSPYFFVRGKPYKVEPGKIEIVYGPKGLPTQVKNILPDGTIYSIDLGSHSISPITTQTTVTPRLEDDSSSTSLPNQEDVSVLSQKVPEKITIQELEQLLPNISAYFEINSEPRFVIHNTPYVVSPGMTKVIPGDKSSSPTISYTYPNGTIYDIKLGGSSVSSGSPSGTYPTDSYESISIEELEKLIPQMSAYYIKDGTPYFVIYGKSYRIEPGKSEIIQDENSSGLTIKYTFPNATVYEIKLGSSEVGSTPSPLVPSILDEDKTKEITIEELEKSISDVSGYFIKNGVTYFVIDGEALVIKPGSTSISKGDDDSSLIIRHVYPNDTIYEVSIENSEASHTSVPHEIITNEPIGDNRVQSIGIKELEKLIPQITGYYILNGVPYFIINGKPHKVKDGNTEVLPEENGSSLIIRHIDQDNNTYEIYLGMKPKVEYQPSLDKGSPISTEKVTEDPSLEYGEPQIITFEELRNLLPKFSGYFVKEGVTFFIIAGKTYKVEPGLIEVIPDDKNSVIFVKYTHPDGNKSEIQLATHSADREPTSIAIKDFENLLANLSGYYVKNGAPYFVINEEPYTINGGVTEIISDQPNSPLTIRHTFPNGTIYDIEVGISSTELSSGSPHSPREEPVVITVDELKNLIPKVTGYYVQDGVTYFMINDKPHKVQPGKTNIKKSEEDGALIIQHENANGTLEEIKLSKEPDQVKEVTITELKDLIPKLTGYYNKNDVPYFIINDMTYIVKPGKTQVTQNDDGSSFVVKNISPEGLVTEINLGKPVQQQESPTTLENEKTPEISIDDLEKNIENVTGYYIRNGVPYFILNDNPYRITPGKTEIVENKDNSSTPLLIRHERPDGSIKEIEIQRNPSDGSQTFEEVQPISFDDFEKKYK